MTVLPPPGSRIVRPAGLALVLGLAAVLSGPVLAAPAAWGDDASSAVDADAEGEALDAAAAQAVIRLEGVELHGLPEAEAADLRAALGIEFTATCLKGRGNYLCPTRLKNAFAHSGDLFSSSEAAELTMIEDWLREHPGGTLSEMDFTPGARVWSLVCSEPHACTPRRCPPGSG